MAEEKTRENGQEEAGPATPRRRLEAMRAVAGGNGEGVRERLLRTVLEVAGERGYRRASVELVLERSGSSRRQFYTHFEGLDQCYAAAYEAWIERVVARLGGAAGECEGDWGERLAAALAELAALVAEQPQLARGLFAEVHVAGGPAFAKRKEVVERLSHAIDSARRELDSPHQPPPITAVFMVGAIDAAVLSDLLERAGGRALTAAIPLLVDWICGAYRREPAAALG